MTKILRRPEVEKLTGISRSSIYALMAKGDFPCAVKITERAVGWHEAAIQQWIETRPQYEPAKVMRRT